MGVDLNPCAGSSVMIVDDEALVLMDLAMTVEELGYGLHSETTNLPAAGAALSNGRPDAALLDIDVGGEPVWPLARRLAALNVPLVFVSANHSHPELRTEFACCQRLDKPVSRQEIATALQRSLAGAPQHAG